MSLETLTTISPTTNKPVVTRPGISSEELALLPETAQAAFRSFSTGTTLAQRQEIVARALGILAQKKDVLGRELTEQMGRPTSYTGVEIATAIKRGEYLNRVSNSVLGEEGTVHGEAEKGFKRYIQRKPVGVALIIFAWNVRCSSAGLLVFDNTDWMLPAVSLPGSSQQSGTSHPCRKRRYFETFAANSYSC